MARNSRSSSKTTEAQAANEAQAAAEIPAEKGEVVLAEAGAEAAPVDALKETKGESKILLPALIAFRPCPSPHVPHVALHLDRSLTGSSLTDRLLFLIAETTDKPAVEVEEPKGSEVVESNQDPIVDKAQAEEAAPASDAAPSDAAPAADAVVPAAEAAATGRRTPLPPTHRSPS